MTEITRTTLSVDFPMVKHFVDYSYLYDYAGELSNLFNRKVGYCTVGPCATDRWYWGILYVGRKPNKAVIKQLLADAKYRPASSIIVRA